MRLPARATTLAMVFLGALLLAPRQLSAQRADSIAVLGVVQRLFDALGSRDTVALRRLLIPGGQFVSVRLGNGPQVTRVTSDIDILRSLSMGTERMLERTWSPIVNVHGPLATVWAPYDFHVDGRTSHCGVDAFSLVRGADGWQIASITYTVELTGCAPSPLGAPR
jgi:hypothetical protein